MAVSQKQYVDNDAAVKKTRSALDKARSDFNNAQLAYSSSRSKDLQDQNKKRLDAAQKALDKAISEEQAAVNKATTYFSNNRSKIQEEDLKKTLANLNEKRKAAEKAGASTAIIDEQIATAKRQATEASKEPAATVGTGTDTGKKTEGGDKTGKFTPRNYANEITTAGQAVAKMTDAGRLALSKSLKNAGYDVKVSGIYSDQLVAAYQRAIGENQIRSSNFQQEIDIESFLKAKAKEVATLGTGAGGTTSDVFFVRTNEQDAKNKINDVFQSRLGRDATAAELKTALNALWSDEDKNPQRDVVTVDAKGNRSTRRVGGTNADQFLNDWIDKNPKLKTDADAYKATSPNVSATQSAKLDYDKQVAAAQGNPEVLAKIKATTVYGQQLTEMENAIRSQVRANDASNTDESIASLAQEALNNGIKIGSSTFNSFLGNKLTYTSSAAGTATGGAGGDTLRKLQDIAFKNGVSLDDPSIAPNVSKWVSDINAGTDPERFYSIIRNKAAVGKSKYVQDQLKAGSNLRDIYGTYLKEMASAFDVAQDSIDINDPLLANAFTSKGATKITDFQNLLRKDSRYLGTPGAVTDTQIRQGIIDAALKSGVTLSDADLENITQEAVSKGLNASSPEIANLIRGKIAYAPGGKLGGAAGNNLQVLRDTAAANGLDLDKSFGGSVQDWLQKINQGESVETYKRVIRDAAKMGLPDNVKKMMDQGVDLATIYSPYKNIMASVLEINPSSIGLDDATLRSAIGPDKEMTIYDFKKALRKDPRWQYTDNANQEASDVALSILRNFGFQG